MSGGGAWIVLLALITFGAVATLMAFVPPDDKIPPGGWV